MPHRRSEWKQRNPLKRRYWRNGYSQRSQSWPRTCNCWNLEAFQQAAKVSPSPCKTSTGHYSFNQSYQFLLWIANRMCIPFVFCAVSFLVAVWCLLVHQQKNTNSQVSKSLSLNVCVCVCVSWMRAMAFLAVLCFYHQLKTRWLDFSSSFICRGHGFYLLILQ